MPSRTVGNVTLTNCNKIDQLGGKRQQKDTRLGNFQSKKLHRDKCFMSESFTRMVVGPSK